MKTSRNVRGQHIQCIQNNAFSLFLSIIFGEFHGNTNEMHLET